MKLLHMTVKAITLFKGLFLNNNNNKTYQKRAFQQTLMFWESKSLDIKLFGNKVTARRRDKIKFVLLRT